MVTKNDDPASDPVMGADFQPLRVLWEGPEPAYPSEQSARWAIRQLQTQLAAAGALGIHRGMVYVHVQTLVSLARAQAIELATKRYSPKLSHERSPHGG